MVRFPLHAGADGATVGSTVTLAGVRAGVVTDITTNDHHDPHTWTGVDLEFRLGIDYQLRSKDTVQWIEPLSGGPGHLNITPALAESTPLLPGELILATPSPDVPARLLGDHAARRLEETIANFRAVIPELVDAKAQTAKSIDAVRLHIQSMRTRIEGDFPLWRTQAAEVASFVEAARVSVAAMQAEDSECALIVSAARSRYAELLSRVAPIPEDFTPLKASIEEITAHSLPDIMARADTAWNHALADISEARELLREVTEAWGTATAELTMTADQISLTEREVILAPWRLLGGALDRPDSSMALARAVALSAIDLQESARATRELLERAGSLARTNPALLQLLREWLDAATKRSQVLERVLSERLQGSGAQVRP